MNLAPYYPWIVFVHVLAAFSFVLSHGVSMFMSDRVRRERDPDRVRALLDVSRATLPIMYGSLLVLLLAGVAAGMIGGHFSRLWIWVALAILIGEAFAMYALATRYYTRLRTALGAAGSNAAGAGGAVVADTGAAEPASTSVVTSQAELDRLLASRRPDVIGVVGLVGLIVIIWLMVVKPF